MIGLPIYKSRGDYQGDDAHALDPDYPHHPSPLPHSVRESPRQRTPKSPLAIRRAAVTSATATCASQPFPVMQVAAVAWARARWIPTHLRPTDSRFGTVLNREARANAVTSPQPGRGVVPPGVSRGAGARFMGGIRRSPAASPADRSSGRLETSNKRLAGPRE